MEISMFRCMIIATAVLSAGCASSGGKLSPARRDAIRAAVLQTDAAMIRAAESLDSDAFFSFIADSDETRILQNGSMLTRAEALPATRQSFEGLASLHYEFANRRVLVLSPTAAMLTAQGKTLATLNDGRKLEQPFVESTTFGLRDGKWRLLVGHLSIPATPNPPTAPK